ncbi:hypothetical protein [Pseudomonas sp. BN102]|nr:hypothetical protein [Pseudomonas sp. BN102]
MNQEQETVDHDASCAAPSGVSSDDWQALEWQLMALMLDADEEGARS